MVQVTRLASKKLTNLFYKSSSFKFELIFLSEVIYSGILNENGFVHCSKQDLQLIIQRLQTFHIGVIGIETSIQHYLGLISFPFEHFNSSGNIKDLDWIVPTTESLFREGKTAWMTFFIDITDEEREILSIITGIPSN